MLYSTLFVEMHMYMYYCYNWHVLLSSSPAQDSIYRWPLLKSEEEKAEEELELARKRAVSPTQEAQVNSVTHELIEWSKNLVIIR